MMECAALKIAVDMVHIPSQVRLVRSAPLPDGIPILLQIAAGDEEVLHEAIQMTGRSREVVHGAAIFFIEQVLFYPQADSYRVLGANSEATSSELRHNMALLLRWLHPDLDPQGKRSIFVSKVTLAWSDLKTREKRVAYDQSRHALLAKRFSLRNKNSTGQRSTNQTSYKRLNNGGSQHQRAVASNRSVHVYTDERGSLLHRLLLFLFGGASN